MKRHDRFFGLHFDFHADNKADIGARTDAEDIAWYITEAHPDFIQCDSKGHAGISSYPTKIGKPAENLKADNLKIWSDTAKKYGIPLYVHHSGIYDVEYTKNNPAQAQMDKNGHRTDKASLFGQYADTYLIPQIKEMIDLYDIDGIWMDGECWAVHDDYSPLAQAHMCDAHTQEERDNSMREAFFAYLKKCGDALHAYKPGFRYISNWAFSSYMPEKPMLDVLDSLSGDYPPTDSVYVARYEGRCLAAQQAPWDLMCWSCMREWQNPDFYSMKTEQQLKQEAAAVLMLGGGFQLYIPQNKDGSAKRLQYLPLRKLADFVHGRRFLFQKKPKAQIGIYYSATSRYKNSQIFNAAGATEELIGTLNCVLSAQYTVNIVMEYQADTFSEYAIMIIPEWKQLCSAEKKKLLQYAENGGNLVVIGAELSRQLGALCGFTFGEIEHDADNLYKNAAGELVRGKRYYFMDDDGGFEQVVGDILDLKCGCGSLYENNDLRDGVLPAYRISEFGKGQVAFVPFDLGSNYFTTRTQKKCKFLKKILNQMERPGIEINKTNIDISVLENGDGILVNLLNLYQNRYDVRFDVFDEVPPLYDVEIVIHGCYQTVFMPLGEEFTYEITADAVKVIVKKLEIHSIIALHKTMEG